MMSGRIPVACGYVRVSTEDQAKHGLSMASQKAAIASYCEKQGIRLALIYEEPGLSGTDEARSRFNEMMDTATSRERPYDLVIVHSLSRFARSSTLQAISYQRLHKVGIEQVSVTETFAKDSSGNMMRTMVSAFNQHLSDETSKHTIRSMNANAAEGFFNGGRVPFGYRSVTVEMRAAKAKKKLEIEPEEAAIVQRMFDLSEHGNGHGPLGARAIADLLNRDGHRLRRGLFFNSSVADILGRTHYVGFYLGARKTELGEPLLKEDWQRVACPRIVGDAQFAAVASRRATRNPRNTPPWVTNGVTLLPATIARCGEDGCDSGLTIRTGKGGMYHY